MSHLSWSVVIGVVGAVVAAFVDHGLEAKGTGRLVLRRIALALIGFAVSISAAETFYFARKLDETHQSFGQGLTGIASAVAVLNQRVTRESVYDSAKKHVAAIQVENAKPLFEARLNEIETDLRSLSTTSMHVRRTEILNTWESLVKGASQCVCATNLVSREDWANVSRDNAGLSVQRDAMRSRGVEIHRINLYDERVPGHREGLRRLRQFQESIGIAVGELPVTWVQENETYAKFLERLATPDVVIVDGNLVLLTRVRSRDYNMESAVLTFDPELVAEAKRYYVKLLGDAGGRLGPSCLRSFALSDVARPAR